MTAVDWRQNFEAPEGAFTSRTTYDALNRGCRASRSRSARPEARHQGEKLKQLEEGNRRHPAASWAPAIKELLTDAPDVVTGDVKAWRSGTVVALA